MGYSERLVRTAKPRTRGWTVSKCVMCGAAFRQRDSKFSGRRSKRTLYTCSSACTREREIAKRLERNKKNYHERKAAEAKK